MLKKMLFMMTGLLIAATAFSQITFTGRLRGRADPVPAPRLLAPLTEEVALSGKDKLEFRWSPHEGSRIERKYYDFRLYKGYNMVESTLVFKKRVPAGKYKIYLDLGLFEPGQIYTWSLRQVYRIGGKSRRSFHSFRAIK
ncbi:MAG: hypothetical protein ACE5JK_03750 [Candidatus Omnitrophota bacterium]